MGRHVHEAVLVESANGAEGTMDSTAEASHDGLSIKLASDMALVEKGDDFVTRLETSDILAYGKDGAGAIRARNDIGSLGEGISAQGDDEITVL
jgi:hypothetical protein